MSLKAHDRFLEDWFAQIGSGQLHLPRFQRFEAWGPREITDLLQTVIAGLPAGSALVLQVGDRPPFTSRPLATAPEGTGATELLLDGQQRLTALWRALSGTYQGRTFFVMLPNGHEGEHEFVVESVSRYERNGRLYPLWAEDPKEALRRNLIPIALLRPKTEGESELRPWLRTATEGDIDRYVELNELATNLRAEIAKFNLPYLRLPAETPKHVVLDVFIKMNTRLVKLSAFDIVVAEVEAETGESLHNLVASLRGQVPGLARYIEPSDMVLDVAALLQDRPPSKAGYLGVDWNRMINQWAMLVDGAHRAVEFFEQELVLDAERFPTRPVIPAIIALWAQAPSSPDQLGRVRTLLRRYLWRSFFTDRYEASAATRVHQDYRDLFTAIQEGRADATARIFDEPIADVDELLEAGWPTKRERLAKGILLLSLQGGALDLADGVRVTPANVKQREYHHLFPKAFLHRTAGDEIDPNRALNCALITWRTNRTISDADPVQYLVERAEAAALGEQELRHRLRSHAIPVEIMMAGDYESFLQARAQQFAHAVKRLCEGRGWETMSDAGWGRIGPHLTTGTPDSSAARAGGLTD